MSAGKPDLWQWRLSASDWSDQAVSAIERLDGVIQGMLEEPGR
ncbi:MAG: hypothetical protein R6V41_03435 [Desulfobacteraceae bacterium]